MTVTSSGEDGLKKAIRASVRTGSVEARLAAIESAKELALADLIPDAWNERGEVEERQTAKDYFVALESAVADAYPDRYTWVQDWDGGEENDGYRAIYQVGGELLACAFSQEDDGKIALDMDSVVKVRPITGYIERSAERRVRHTRSLERRKARLPKRGEREVRTLPIEDFELRDSDEKEGVKELLGYASVFNRSYDIGPYEERIMPGSFKRALKNADLDCVLRMEHEDLPLARTSSGTLELSEDATGLQVRADLALDDPDVQRLIPKMRRKDLREMSFAFRCTDDEWSDDYLHRTVKAADIHRGDVSIVTYGASPTTSATLRHAEEALTALRGFGADAFIEAWVEWRDHTLIPVDQRAGKAISAANMEVLSHVLNLVASADDAVDEAQPLLAELMSVANPDDDERSVELPGTETVIVPVNHALRSRARRLAAKR